MATNFPVSLDSLANPSSGDTLNSPSHSGQHANANDAIEAIQAKLGIDGSGVVTSVDYILNNVVATRTGTQTLTNKTISLTSNTVTGTLSEFNTALSGDNFVSLTGTETLTNKTLTAPRFADLGFIADSNGNELIIFDSNTSAVNEITLSNAATGVAPAITATGNDSNINVNIVPKGTGVLQSNGVNVVTISASQTLTNKTLTTPTITAPRFADLDFIADTNGNELIILDSNASAVNEITVANAATSDAPTISATGGDTNINLNLVSKGTGTVRANNIDVVTTTETQTLTNKTLTSPVISTISNSGTVTLPTGTRTLVARDTTDTLTNKTLTAPNITGGIVDQLQENWNIVATAPPASVNFDVSTASILYYSSTATATFTVNVRGNVSTPLYSLLLTGDSITITLVINNIANTSTAYAPTSFSIDSNAVTVRWLGNATPVASLSSIDVYTYTIVRTADGSPPGTPATYLVLGSQALFR